MHEDLRRHARARLWVLRRDPRVQLDEARGRSAYLKALLREIRRHEVPHDALDAARSTVRIGRPEAGFFAEDEHQHALDALCGL